MIEFFAGTLKVVCIVFFYNLTVEKFISRSYQLALAICANWRDYHHKYTTNSDVFGPNNPKQDFYQNITNVILTNARNIWNVCFNSL